MSKYKKVLIGFLGCAVVAATFLCGRIVGILDKSAAAVSIIGGADGPTSVFLAGKAGGGESTEADTAEHMITVTGEGFAKAKPDRVKISYVISTIENDAESCQKKSAEDLSSAIEMLKGLGVAETSIQMSDYGINPVYNWESEEQSIEAYKLETTMTASDIPMEQAGTILTAVVSAGADWIQSVSYYSSSYEAEYQKALESAEKAARTKAEAMAMAQGRRLGVTVAVREEGYYTDARYGNTEVRAQVSVDFLTYEETEAEENLQDHTLHETETDSKSES